MFKECHNNNMVPFLLPSIMLVAEQATEEEFAKYILPDLIPIFKMTEPVQVSNRFLVSSRNFSLIL